MAMAMAAAAAHTAPPFPLPALPRVRPPPIPKGTPGTAKIPQPVGVKPPHGKVWADGKWRDPLSSSVKNKRAIQSRQLEKALRHEIHGMHIYAYRNSETNQVVYSLTKIMENTKMLKQLIFHGKKTVAPRLRRDMWRPYFSIHFPQTPSGAAKGLRCYQEIRELALRRQLDPPKELIIATDKDLEDYVSERFAPDEWENIMERTPQKIREKAPWPGKVLPQWMRAKRLMDMRGTSVADVAAVLSRNRDVIKGLTPVQQMKINELLRKAEKADMSIRARTRLNRIKRKELEKADDLNARKALFFNPDVQADLERHTKERIALEYEGVTNAGDALPKPNFETEDAEETSARRIATEEFNLLQRTGEQTLAEQGPEMLLQTLLSEMRAERDLFLHNHQKEVVAELEKQSGTMSQQERTDLQQQAEQAQVERVAKIEANLVTETSRPMRKRLEERRRELREEMLQLKALPELDAQQQQQKADSKAELSKLSKALSALMMRQPKKTVTGSKYVGPLAALGEQLDAGLAEIDKKYQPKRAELLDKIEAIETAEDQHQVVILWADMRDGAYVPNWPDTVRHELLQPKAAIKKAKLAVRQHEHIDEDEELVTEQRARRDVQISSTVHVFGSESPHTGQTGRWLTSDDLATSRDEQRAQRAEDWSTTEPVLVRQALTEKRTTQEEALSRFADTIPESLQYLYALFQYLESLQADLTDLDSIRKEAGQNADDSRQVVEKEEDIRATLNWLSDEVLPEATLEITTHNLEPGQPHPISSDRLNWARSQIDLLNIELRYPAARNQANLYADFRSQFTQRETIETRITHLRRVIASTSPSIPDINTATPNEIEQTSEEIISQHRHSIPTAPTALQGPIQSLITETTSLVTFDRANPLPKDLQDREHALRARIAEKQQEFDSLNVYQPTSEGVSAEEDAERQQEILRLMEDMRGDSVAIERLRGEAWVEFKRSNGLVSGFSGRGEGDRGLKSNDEVGRGGEDDVVQVERPSLWGRVKGVFGRK